MAGFNATQNLELEQMRVAWRQELETQLTGLRSDTQVEVRKTQEELNRLVQAGAADRVAIQENVTALLKLHAISKLSVWDTVTVTGPSAQRHATSSWEDDLKPFRDPCERFDFLRARFLVSRTASQ